MKLYQNKENGKLVVLGAKNLYGIRELDFKERGYVCILEFNSAWDHIKSSDNITFIQTINRRLGINDVETWLKKTPLTEEWRVKKELLELKRMIKSLESKIPTP